MKRELNQNKTGNEVYYTACYLLVLLKNSSGKRHCQRGFNSIPISYQIGAASGNLAQVAPDYTTVEQLWHMEDSQGQIPALAFRKKSLKPLKLFPLYLRNYALHPFNDMPPPAQMRCTRSILSHTKKMTRFAEVNTSMNPSTYP